MTQPTHTNVFDAAHCPIWKTTLDNITPFTITAIHHIINNPSFSAKKVYLTPSYLTLQFRNTRSLSDTYIHKEDDSRRSIMRISFR